MEENLQKLINSCRDYMAMFLEGNGKEIPPPPENFQAIIREINIKDFGNKFKSDFSYKELDDIKHLTELGQINKIKENAQMDDATVVSVVLSVARLHLTGRYTSQINFLLAIVGSKPDREELIWKSSSKV